MYKALTGKGCGILDSGLLMEGGHPKMMNCI